MREILGIRKDRACGLPSEASLQLRAGRPANLLPSLKQSLCFGRHAKIRGGDVLIDLSSAGLYPTSQVRSYSQFTTSIPPSIVMDGEHEVSIFQERDFCQGFISLNAALFDFILSLWRLLRPSDARWERTGSQNWQRGFCAFNFRLPHSYGRKTVSAGTGKNSQTETFRSFRVGLPNHTDRNLFNCSIFCHFQL